MWGSLIRRIQQIYSSPLFAYFIVVAFFLFILTYHLASQPKLLSPAEIATSNNTQSLSLIANNPINAPHKLLGYLLVKSGIGGVVGLRLSSVIFGTFFGLCFFVLVRSWYGKVIGLLSTIVFVTTPLFLILCRTATSDVMFLAPIAVMAGYVWALRTTKNNSRSWALLILLSAFLAYTPGILLWLIVAAIVCRRKLIDHLSELPRLVILALSFVAALIITPLIIAIVRDWTLIKTLMLVPAHFSPMLETLKHIGWMAAAIFIKAPSPNSLIIGRLPIINLIQIVFLIFGLFAMIKATKTKTSVLLLTILFSIVAAGLNNNFVLLTLGLPAIGVFLGAGLRYLYIEWRGVFPRNPVAKSLAITLMSGAVIVNLAFGVRYSLIAWPQIMAKNSLSVLK